MLDIAVIKSAGRLFTLTPYHPQFSSLAKDLGGRYVGSPIWSFNPRFESEVRALIIDFFGTDDLQTAPTVTALVPLAELPGIGRKDSDVYLFGRPLVSRRKPGRDITLGDKDTIEIVRGNIPRQPIDRSSTNLDFTADTVLKVSRIPAAHRDLDLSCLQVEAEQPDPRMLIDLEQDLRDRLAIVQRLRRTAIPTQEV
jgi:hypothetical protein